jgi:lipopolysaccharide transport system ATP-binding protein
MSDSIITVENLGKKYVLGHQKTERYTALRDVMAEQARSLSRRMRQLFGNGAGEQNGTKEEFWALKDVSFEVKQGDRVGIIGRNGAGKSTLLKVLSRITEPTTGRVRIKGRVASLLEVGTGFHPELTGRENIYLNGAILGMSKAEIKRKFDEIVAFAEVEKFLDTPVKRYSSGMYVRLAFAVAAHLEPEVLVVDEVLAVGDIAFQKKCLGKMNEVSASGRTVIFVSHNMAAITQLCKQILWMDQGQLRMYGSFDGVVPSYLSHGHNAKSHWKRTILSSDVGEGILTEAHVHQESLEPLDAVRFDKNFCVSVGYSLQESQNIAILLRITTAMGTAVFTTWDTDTTEWREKSRLPGDYVSTCTIPGGILRPGKYFLTIGICNAKKHTWQIHEDILSLQITDIGYTLNIERIGVITPLLKWDVLMRDQIEGA